MLLDPNTLSQDGTVAVNGRSVSRDGRYLAYALSSAGSDWMTWHVRDVATGKDLADEVKWSKFSGASWAHDGRGFYYSAYDRAEDQKQALTAANYDQKLYFHALGTPQSADRLVYARPDHQEWGFAGDVTDDGHYLVITVWKGTDPKNQLFYADLTAEHPKVVELLTGFDAKWSFVGNEGHVFYLLTDDGASRRKLVALDLAHPDREAMREVIPEGQDTLEARQPRGRPPGGPLPRRRQEPGGGPRPDGQAGPRGVPAGARHRRGLRGPRRRPGDLLLLHLVRRADDHLPLRHRHREGDGLPASPRSTSTRTPSWPSRSSTPARMAPGCRCSSPTRRA